MVRSTVNGILPYVFSYISHFVCLYNFNYTGRPLHGPGIIEIKTFAGWAVVASLYMCNEEHPTVNCRRVAAMEVCSGRHLDHHFVVENKVREIVTPQVRNNMFELDFSERNDDKEQGHS